MSGRRRAAVSETTANAATLSGRGGTPPRLSGAGGPPAAMIKLSGTGSSPSPVGKVSEGRDGSDSGAGLRAG